MTGTAGFAEGADDRIWADTAGFADGLAKGAAGSAEGADDWIWAGTVVD